MAQRHAKRTRQRSRRRVSLRQLDALIDEAIMDTYGESEQRVGFLSMLEQKLAVPFTTEILGTPTRVDRVDVNDADEIVAVCRSQQTRSPALRQSAIRPSGGSLSERRADHFPSGAPKDRAP